MKYIIEHLEPRLYKWCIIEYTHISKIVGKANLIFTNIKSEKAREKLIKLGEVRKESIADTSDLGSCRACVLDPEAETTLSPDDSKNFCCIIFGGILGDYPPRKRTKEELTDVLKKKGKKFETRNLGKEQMATNTAVYVTKKILDGTPLSKIIFMDEIEIEINEGESIQLPFRYVIEDGKAVLPEGFVEFLKTRKEF